MKHTDEFKRYKWANTTLPEFLTEAQIERCILIFTNEPGSVAKAICEKVIRPNITEINAKLGQDNDPMYLAYAVEAVLRRAASGGECDGAARS